MKIQEGLLITKKIDQLICCATCKNRGRGFKTKDKEGIQHCSKYNRRNEELCVNRNHQGWESEG